MRPLHPDQVSPLRRPVVPFDGNDHSFVWLSLRPFFLIICQAHHKCTYGRSPRWVVRGSGGSDRGGGVTRVLNLYHAVALCKNPLTIWDLHDVIKNDKTHRLGFKKKNLSYVTNKSKSCLESGKLQEGKSQPFR